MGLCLAKKIVLDHGGTIALQSQLGLGTTVSIRLPQPPAPDPAPTNC
jgi:signal transduction histidine kinase